MGTVITSGKNTLAEQHEVFMFGGNCMWANPEKARRVGAQMLGELAERHSFVDMRAETPEMFDTVAKIFSDALSVINYAALPTERRANILHGLIDAAAKAGVLGGEPEWAEGYRAED